MLRLCLPGPVRGKSPMLGPWRLVCLLSLPCAPKARPSKAAGEQRCTAVNHDVGQDLPDGKTSGALKEVCPEPAARRCDLKRNLTLSAVARELR